VEIVVDKGDARAGAYIRCHGGAWQEVVEQVGHYRKLLDAAVDVAEDVAEVRSARAVVAAEHAFELDARTDEVVSHHAADGIAEIHVVVVAVQQPVQAALSPDIDTREGGAGIPYRLALRGDRQAGCEGDGDEQGRLRCQSFPRWRFLPVQWHEGPSRHMRETISPSCRRETRGVHRHGVLRRKRSGGV